MILDEGHKIKNPSKTTKAIHGVAARHRIILSGTPIQNNLKVGQPLFCSQSLFAQSYTQSATVVCSSTRSQNGRVCRPLSFQNCLEHADGTIRVDGLRFVTNWRFWHGGGDAFSSSQPGICQYQQKSEI